MLGALLHELCYLTQLDRMVQSNRLRRFTLQAVILTCLVALVLQAEAEYELQTSVLGEGSALLEGARGDGATEVESRAARKLELRGSSGLTLRVRRLLHATFQEQKVLVRQPALVDPWKLLLCLLCLLHMQRNGRAAKSCRRAAGLLALSVRC